MCGSGMPVRANLLVGSTTLFTRRNIGNNIRPHGSIQHSSAKKFTCKPVLRAMASPSPVKIPYFPGYTSKNAHAPNLATFLKKPWPHSAFFSIRIEHHIGQYAIYPIAFLVRGLLKELAVCPRLRRKGAGRACTRPWPSSLCV